MRLLVGLAVAAVVGGVTVASVAAAHDRPQPAPSALASSPSPAVSSPTSPTPTQAAPSPAARDAGSSDAALPVPLPGGRPDPGDVPVRVRIPAIGVDSPLVDLGIAEDGTMQVPTDWQKAGWLTAAPVPGQRGPAVIAGHVDSHEGPAVFFRLSELEPGDLVAVEQEDGDVVTFTVRRLEKFAKDDFPTDLVYGPAPGPVLRLITCSGEIDPVSGHYVDNTVVFAS